MDTHKLIEELTHDAASNPDILFAVSTMDGLTLRFDDQLRKQVLQALLEQWEMGEEVLAMALANGLEALQAVPFGFSKGETLGEICRVLQVEASEQTMVFHPFTPTWEDGFLIKKILTVLGHDLKFYGTDDCSDPEEVYVLYKK